MPLSFLQPLHIQQRCRSELRRGNPVILQSPQGKACLFVALDTLTGTTWQQLQQEFSTPWRLVLSTYRWQYLCQEKVNSEDRNEVCVITIPPLSFAELQLLLSSKPQLPWQTSLMMPANQMENKALPLLQQSGLIPMALTQLLSQQQTQQYINQHYFLPFKIESLPNSLPNKALLEFIVETNLPLRVNRDNRLLFFREIGSEAEHLAIIVGKPDLEKPVLLRLHSSCLTGDVLGSLRCDCGPQLEHAFKLLVENGGGVLLYLQQEGRNIGLANKLRSYQLQDQGFDTLDANLSLGFSGDERSFQLAVEILNYLNIKTVRLLSNNPLKVQALEKGGIQVQEIRLLQVGQNPHNEKYLSIKKQRMGHQL